MPDFYVVPHGMEKVVLYMKGRYNNIPMYITENGNACTFTKCAYLLSILSQVISIKIYFHLPGYSQSSTSNAAVEDLVDDVERVDFMHGHLTYLSSAIRHEAKPYAFTVYMATIPKEKKKKKTLYTCKNHYKKS